MTRYSDDSDELTGGRWVPVNGVIRWVPDEPKTPPVLACPECLATIAEPCTSQSGHTRADHDGRLIPFAPAPPPAPPRLHDAARRCECGTPLPARKRGYCSEECRAAARRESWRKYAAKRAHASRCEHAYEQERAS